MTKTDAFTEIYLGNLNMDRLVRVLQRLELHSIRSRRELKGYAIRLEEIRAGVNAVFYEVMPARERADEFRFWCWRIALETQTEPVNGASPFYGCKWDSSRDLIVSTLYTVCGFDGPTE